MSAPTDLELMLFHDGELDEPRRAEVARFLAADGSAVAQQKLTGLALGGDILRESALERAGAFDIADAVMASCESATTNGGAAAPDAQSNVVDIRARAAQKSAEKATKDVEKTSERQDGGRILLPLTALAAAAAVVLFLWGKSGSDAEVAKTQPTEQVQEPVKDLPPAPTAVPSPSNTEMLGSTQEDAQPSVQVASVDFGSRTGAVYYVAGAAEGATTTVVWVTEE
mgnify:CR=1 FL=1